MLVSRGRPLFSLELVNNGATAMAPSTVELNKPCTFVHELEVVVDVVDSKEFKNAM